jgi:hypothetical protein
MFMSKQIRDPEVDPNEIQKTLWIGGHIIWDYAFQRFCSIRF